mmetsp:Transcript_60051/g.190767  ORF Transcript_60051/g.190767 Transcript_60051/m.190767 type:complete len:328 (-) Transcript_60051:474-1457(-)
MMHLAPVSPGGGWGPFSTSFFSRSMLYGVTISGTVRLRAIDHGTPSWSMEMLGSAVITVRAEKSTRFPIRFPRIRPSLDLSRWEIDLIGRPERCSDCGCPAIVLSKYVAMWYCRSCSYSCVTCTPTPAASLALSMLLVRMISASLCVRSSSDRAVESIITPGRTAPGGMGSTVMMNQSGRAHLGLRPRTRTSSSVMPLRILCAFSALMTCLRSVGSTPPSSSSPLLGANSAMNLKSMRAILGWRCPHPPVRFASPFSSISASPAASSPPPSQTDLVLAMSRIARILCCGLRIRMACLNLWSFLSTLRREQLKHTQRRMASTVLMNPI